MFTLNLYYSNKAGFLMREFDKKIIGKTIKALRHNAGLTQSQLAEKVGLSEKHISKIEQGANLPALDNFLKIADLLQINIPEFGVISDNQSPIRKEVLRLISTANDEELTLYRDILLSIKRNLNNNQK